MMKQKLQRAILNKNYYPTYAAYGVGGILLITYVTDWKRFGKLIPVWNKRFEETNH